MFPFHRESLISLTFRTKKPPQKRSGPFPVPNERTRKKPAQKQSTSKTRCTSVLPRKRFVRPLHGLCPKANGGSSIGPGSIQTARQVFRLWHPRLKSLPSHAVRTVASMNLKLLHYGGGPAQVSHLLPYSPGQRNAPGTLCRFVVP